jgi:hypothetical protein
VAKAEDLTLHAHALIKDWQLQALLVGQLRPDLNRNKPFRSRPVEACRPHWLAPELRLGDDPIGRTRILRLKIGQVDRVDQRQQGWVTHVESATDHPGEQIEGHGRGSRRDDRGADRGQGGAISTRALPPGVWSPADDANFPDLPSSRVQLRFPSSPRRLPAHLSERPSPTERDEPVVAGQDLAQPPPQLDPRTLAKLINQMVLYGAIELALELLVITRPQGHAREPTVGIPICQEVLYRVLDRLPGPAAEACGPGKAPKPDHGLEGPADQLIGLRGEMTSSQILNQAHLRIPHLHHALAALAPTAVEVEQGEAYGRRNHLGESPQCPDAPTRSAEDGDKQAEIISAYPITPTRPRRGAVVAGGYPSFASGAGQAREGLVHGLNQGRDQDGGRVILVARLPARYRSEPLVKMLICLDA